MKISENTEDSSTVAEKTKTKLYAYCTPCAKPGLGWKKDIHVISEYGDRVHTYTANSRVEGMCGVGISTKKMHFLYDSIYPNGYHLIWVAYPEYHAGLQRALQKDSFAGGV